MPTKTTKKTEPVSVPEPEVIKTIPLSPVDSAYTNAAPVKKDILIPILVGAIIIAAFGVGFLYGKVTVYEKLGVNNTAAAQAGTQTAQAGTPAQATPTVTLDQIKTIFADKKNLIFGNLNSKLLFVEFSDPSCPYCHIAGGKDGELNKQVGDRFKLKEDGGTYVAPVTEMKKLVDQGKAAFAWVFSPGHGNGELATQALYCAQDQGKFWPVHDLLMSNAGYNLLNQTVQNDKTKIPQLVDLLKPVINTNTMTECLTSGKYAGRIQTDEALAKQFGVEGTPSFYVNDKNFGGAYSFTDMQSVVDAALK